FPYAPRLQYLCICVHVCTPVVFDYRKAPCADSRLLWQYWQHDVRWMLGIMQHRLAGHAPRGCHSRVFTTVRIALPPREIAARHVQPYAMPRQECDCTRPEVNADFVDAARLDQPRGRSNAVTVPQ